jgi:peptidyl-dipeptidase Dcp
MKRILYVPAFALLLLSTACGPNQKTKNNETMGENPLLTASNLPYGAPDFTKIKNEHFQPAIEQGMKLKKLQTTPKRLLLRIPWLPWKKAGKP